jgi:hypothetical protein
MGLGDGGARVQGGRGGRGGHRDFLILDRPAGRNNRGGRPAETEVHTFAEAGAGPLDLRKPRDVAKLARALERLDLSGLG